MSDKHRPALPVVYAPLAISDLDEVWDRNQKAYGQDHAARYVDYLRRQIDSLGEFPARGRTLKARKELRYVRIGKRMRGHGYIAVYRIDGGMVSILHIFHTAQDWQAKLAENG